MLRKEDRAHRRRTSRRSRLLQERRRPGRRTVGRVTWPLDRQSGPIAPRSGSLPSVVGDQGPHGPSRGTRIGFSGSCIRWSMSIISATCSGLTFRSICRKNALPLSRCSDLSLVPLLFIAFLLPTFHAGSAKVGGQTRKRGRALTMSMSGHGAAVKVRVRPAIFGRRFARTAERRWKTRSLSRP
jgi:hypothetical protein